MANLNHILCLDDFENEAKKILPRPIFGYVSGATETNASLRYNRTAFDDWAWLPRVLNDVSKRSTATSILSKKFEAPFGIAPMGIAALTAYRGDIALAKAAEAENIPMIQSSSSLIAIEEVLKAAPSTWFQLYLPREIKDGFAMLERLKKAGCHTLVLTVDSSVVPNRENNLRNRFKTPLEPNLRLLIDGLTHPRWTWNVLLRTLATKGMPHFENVGATRGSALIAKSVERDFSGREHIDWKMIQAMREYWKGDLILKGILNPLDAEKAKALGADGIILSNHGGRQLDGTVSPLKMLPTIRSQLGDEYLVMIDSGFRRGTDILKAIALGADFVFIGRPFNYAATVAEEAGVIHAIKLLKSELRANLGLLGKTSVNEVNKELLVPNT